MSRSRVDHVHHLAHRPREEADGGRVLRFLRIERAQEVHPAVRALHARGATPEAQGGLAPFLRNLHGHLADHPALIASA